MSGASSGDGGRPRAAAFIQELFMGRRAPVAPASPLQRPAIYVPGLGDRPWHDPSSFEWTARLESAHPVILAELSRVRAEDRGFQTYREPSGTTHRELHDRGDWSVFYFWFEGRKLEENCARCPETARVLESIPRRGGLACFSVLAPGTHVTPHCAPFNVTLRCHLGLANLEHARIRVGTEARRWEPGKCLVLDDTFEHEVWVEGDAPRAVLIVDFFHPSLGDAEVEELRELWRSPPAQAVLAPWYEIVGATEPKPSAERML